jgi:hypothetical protein
MSKEKSSSFITKGQGDGMSLSKRIKEGIMIPFLSMERMSGSLKRSRPTLMN